MIPKSLLTKIQKQHSVRPLFRHYHPLLSRAEPVRAYFNRSVLAKIKPLKCFVYCTLCTLLCLVHTDLACVAVHCVLRAALLYDSWALKVQHFPAWVCKCGYICAHWCKWLCCESRAYTGKCSLRTSDAAQCKRTCWHFCYIDIIAEKTEAASL